MAVKTMHTSSLDCSDVVSTIASMLTYDVITRVTACAAAYCVSLVFHLHGNYAVS